MRAERDQLVRALDTLDDVFYVYDATDGLVYWNRRLEELFDLTGEQLHGMDPAEFFLPGDRADVAAAVGDIYETGETVVEAVADTTEGRIQFELTGRLVTDEDGTVVGFAGTGRDVTDRRTEEWQLAQENRRLAEFADVLAHDLRNPLSVASGHLSLVRVDVDDPALVDHLDRLGAAHARIESIIADVRRAAREGGLATDPEPVSLATVARQAWDTVDTASATLDCRVAGTVTADAQRLQRLFENLFRNSVEHGSTGNRIHSDDGVAIRVRVVDTDTGFAVEDDGPGIPDERRDEIFEPGISLADGTGFGLYIVQSIVRAHGWSVTVTEGPEGGARFEFDCGSAEASGDSASPVQPDGSDGTGVQSVDEESEATDD